MTRASSPANLHRRRRWPWIVLVLVAIPIAFLGGGVLRILHDSPGAPGTALGDRAFTLVLHCTPGLRFHGSYMIWTARGTASSQDLSGSCPSSGVMSIDARGALVSATAQKQSEDGWLALTIQVDRKPSTESSETTQPYGVVVAATR